MSARYASANDRLSPEFVRFAWKCDDGPIPSSSFYNLAGVTINPNTLRKRPARTASEKGVMHVVITGIGVNMPIVLQRKCA